MLVELESYEENIYKKIVDDIIKKCNREISFYKSSKKENQKDSQWVNGKFAVAESIKEIIEIELGVYNNEEWREIPSFNGFYEVSTKGQIRRKSTKKIIKQNDSHGYKTCTLKGKTLRVHRVVAEAFLKNDDNLPIVNHKDGDKRNNNLENLEYSTYRDNIIHAYKMNLRPSISGKRQNLVGERGNSKLTVDQVKEILDIFYTTGFGERRISKITGVSRSIIGGIIRGRTWKHIKEQFDKERKLL